MEVSHDTERRKTTLPVYTDTVEFLDKLRPQYEDGTKESWDYFLMKLGKIYKERNEEAIA